ncbi:hypothetical protein ACERK3_18270 [Phycisphaerales bacterium AB-hyl4]|uniref:Lipoprotein n=1 Tax=Natronomicrosphaera hydrolytica TaxID=3242702 RepID=A0ABV4UBA3_9BACT
MQQMLGLSVTLLVALIAGCSSPSAEPTSADRSTALPDFSPPKHLGDILAILNQLPRTDAPPATEAMAIVLAASASPRMHDGIHLLVWHDAAHSEVWVQQSGGYPGVDIWFGPGSADLLPTRRHLTQPFVASRQ